MLNNVLLRISAYYLAAIAFIAGLMGLFPQIGEYQLMERSRSARSETQSLDFSSAGNAELPEVVGISQLLDPQTSIPVIMAMLVALLMVLPVVWVYHWTRPRKRYSQGFAHTLFVVPIAIALVVFLVKGSLALAFSLAGIVAAVRFRTSLDEPMDAVYMFIVIGIGLACGVQLAVVAFLASIVFNFVALVVWRTNFGSAPAILDGWKLVQPGDDGQLLGVSGSMIPDTPGTPEEEKSPYNAILKIQTTSVEAAQRAAVPILEENAKNWRIAQVIRNEDGTSVVEFDVRLRKSANLAAFIKEIEQTETTTGKIELKNK